MIQLQEASTDHRHYLYRLVCDPVTRAMAMTTAIPSWSDHCEWFQDWLDLPNARRWIVTQNDAPVGQVWCLRDTATALITVNLQPDLRGRGIGRMAIALATQDAVETWNLPVIAKIKQANVASRKAFTHAGYDQVTDGPVCTYAYGLTLDPSTV